MAELTSRPRHVNFGSTFFSQAQIIHFGEGLHNENSPWSIECFSNEMKNKAIGTIESLWSKNRQWHMEYTSLCSCIPGSFADEFLSCYFDLKRTFCLLFEVVRVDNHF